MHKRPKTQQQNPKGRGMMKSHTTGKLATIEKVHSMNQTARNAAF